MEGRDRFLTGELHVRLKPGRAGGGGKAGSRDGEEASASERPE